MPNEKPGMFGIPADSGGDDGQKPQQGQPQAPAPDTGQGQPQQPQAPDQQQTQQPAPGTQQGQPQDPNAPAEPKAPEGEQKKPDDQGQPEDVQKQFEGHFQTRYQKAMEFLNSQHPEVRQELSDFLSGNQQPQSGYQGQPGSQGPAPQQQPPAGQEQSTGQQILNEAPDPIENPQAFAQYVSRLSAEENRKMMQAFQQEQQQQSLHQRFVQEYNDVEQQVRAFVSPSGTPGSPDYYSGVPEDVVQEAMNTVLYQYKIPGKQIGGPTARFRAFVNEVDRIMSKRTVNQRQTEITAEASQQAAQLAQMQQPSPTGSIAPDDKSPQQKHLEAMGGINGPSIQDLINQGKQ